MYTLPPSESSSNQSRSDDVDDARKNQPTDDSFKRMVKPTKGDIERAAGQRMQKEQSSLFDLSRTRPKPKTSLSAEEESDEQIEFAPNPSETEEQKESDVGEKKESKGDVKAKEEPKTEAIPKEIQGADLEAKETEEIDPIEGKEEANPGEAAKEAPVLKRKGEKEDGKQEGFSQEGENAINEPAPLKNSQKEAPPTPFTKEGEQGQEEIELPPTVANLLKDLMPKQAPEAKTLENQASTLIKDTPKPSEEGKEAKSKWEAKKSGEAKAKASSSIQGEISGINPALQGAQMHSQKTAFEEPVDHSVQSTMKELAGKLVEAIHVMKKDGLTETIVTLKSPPLFSGATITLTEFSHAKGEFNIRFANLSQQAKTFLDEQLSQGSLNKHMEGKGVVIHMVATSTQPEQVFSKEPEFNRERGEGEKEKEQQKDSSEENQKKSDS